MNSVEKKTKIVKYRFGFVALFDEGYPLDRYLEWELDPNNHVEQYHKESLRITPEKKECAIMIYAPVVAIDEVKSAPYFQRLWSPSDDGQLA